MNRCRRSRGTRRAPARRSTRSQAIPSGALTPRIGRYIPSIGKGAVDSLNGRGVPAQMIAFPGLTHFQPYSNTGFEVGSTLAADWFAKHLGSGHN